jgi:hypothetical protein
MHAKRAKVVFVLSVRSCALVELARWKLRGATARHHPPPDRRPQRQSEAWHSPRRARSPARGGKPIPDPGEKGFRGCMPPGRIGGGDRLATARRTFGFS